MSVVIYSSPNASANCYMRLNLPATALPCPLWRTLGLVLIDGLAEQLGILLHPEAFGEAVIEEVRLVLNVGRGLFVA